MELKHVLDLWVIPIKSAQQGRGFSTSLTFLTFVLPSSSWHGSGVMPLHEDLPFSMALVVQLWCVFSVYVIQILPQRSVSRTDKTCRCVESAYILFWCVCVSWMVLESPLDVTYFLFCLQNTKQTTTIKQTNKQANTL